jgi:antagonist of KipI
MSLTVIKAGLLDTVQDTGRYGYQHLGINPTGAMDHMSAQLANSLLGNSLDKPVLEMHFPAPVLQFGKETIICLTGAHFSPAIDGVPVPLNRPLMVAKNARLSFTKMIVGARCYAAFLQGLEIEPWLQSCSTHLKARAGGWQGRALQKGDTLPYAEIKNKPALAKGKKFEALPWKVPEMGRHNNKIGFIQGAEWNLLTAGTQKDFKNLSFYITTAADRMGYRLSGIALHTALPASLISSGVSFGTVQLLPSGQLVILMADHQTTGGYPKIAHVITAHLPRLAQMVPQENFSFYLTDLATAEKKLAAQHRYLQLLKNTCKLKMEEWL